MLVSSLQLPLPFPACSMYGYYVVVYYDSYLSMHTVIIVSKPQAERTPRLGAAGCHNTSLPSKIRGMLLLQRAPSSMRSAVLPILALLCVLGASAASSSGIAPPRADRSSRRMGPLGRNRHVTASDPPGHGASPQPSRELRGGAAKMAGPAAAASGSAVLNGSFEGDLVRSVSLIWVLGTGTHLSGSFGA